MYKAFLALFSGGLVGKGLGIIRELLLASLLGTGPLIAAYRVAQTSILVPINFFTADVLTAAIIPLSKRYKEEGNAAYHSLIGVLQLAFAIFSLLLAIVVYRYAGWFVACLTPGLAPEVTQQAVAFAKILALGIPPYVVGGLFSYLEMGQGGYSLASVRASIQSLGLIAGTFLAVYWNAPLYLAGGFTIAYYLYAFWGAALLLHKGILADFKLPDLAELRRIVGDVWTIVRPLIVLPFILQGNVAIERGVASYMGADVVAALDYARFITESGLILLAVPMGLAGLSILSGLNRIEFNVQLSRVLPLLTMIVVPLSVFLWVHSELIVHLLYERGAFNAQSARQTQIIVQGLAMGFWAQVIGYVLTKALNAQLRNFDVLRLTAISVVANLCVNLLCYRLLGPIVLGVSVSVSSVVLVVVALRYLQLSMVLQDIVLWLLLGTVGYLVLINWAHFSGWLGLTLQLAIAVVYWVAYVRIVPALYMKTAPLFEHRPWSLA